MVVSVRAFELLDTEAAVEVANQCCRQEGIRWRARADTLMELGRYGVEPLRHWFVARVESRIIGLAPLFCEMGCRLVAPLWVLPPWRGTTAEEQLVQAILSVADDFSEPVLDIPLNSMNQASAAMLMDRLGFCFIRSWWTMRVDLSQGFPSPVWPDGIHAHTFVANQDEPMLTTLMNDVFSEHWGEGQHTLEEIQHDVAEAHFNPDLLLFAESGKRAIGYAWTWINREVILDTGDACAFIGDLGVTRAYRRQGIGRALLLRILHDAQRRGMEAAELEVDGPNASARHLYESTGFRLTQERLWYRRELRPGIGTPSRHDRR